MGKLTDGGGLFRDVRANGSGYWRMKYRLAGKERLLSFGVYPDVALAEARRRRDAAREVILDGRDPMANRKADKARAKLSSDNTFQAIAEEWLEKQRAKLAAVTATKAEWLLGMAYADLGRCPVAEIAAREVLSVLQTIEAAGTADADRPMSENTINERSASAGLRQRHHDRPRVPGDGLDPLE